LVYLTQDFSWILCLIESISNFSHLNYQVVYLCMHVVYFFCQSSVVVPWLSFYLWLSMMIFFRGFRMICWLCMQVIRVYIMSWKAYINLKCVKFLCFLNAGWTPGLYSQLFVYANFLIWGVYILYFIIFNDLYRCCTLYVKLIIAPLVKFGQTWSGYGCI
jgi:hypothetical protein